MFFDIYFFNNKNCICIKADKTNESETIDLFSKVEDEFGNIDILLCSNVGYYSVFSSIVIFYNMIIFYG